MNGKLPQSRLNLCNKQVTDQGIATKIMISCLTDTKGTKFYPELWAGLGAWKKETVASISSYSKRILYMATIQVKSKTLNTMNTYGQICPLNQYPTVLGASK